MSECTTSPETPAHRADLARGPELDAGPDPEHPAGPRSVAVITGGSVGLGRALAEALAERGWSLVLDARREDRLATAVSDLRAITTVIGVPGDVTKPDHRAALVDAARALGGQVGLLVNNASTLGASPLPPLANLPLDVLRRTFEVNVIAPLGLTQAFLPLLEPGSVILNITSDAATEPYERWGGYGSSKAALEQLSRVLTVENPSLRVLIVDPGDLRTEMHQAAFPGEDISDRPLPEAAVPGLVALIEDLTAQGRHQLRPAATTTEVM